MNANKKVRSSTLIVILFVAQQQCDAAPDKKCIEICTTVACNQTASSIRQYMDTTVQPCDDFYKFTCGNFIKNAIISEEHGTNDTFNMIENNNVKLLKKSLESINETNENPEVFKKLKSYYDVCMDYDRTKIDNKAEFKKKIAATGGWPLMIGESWDDKKFNWIETAFKLRAQNFTLQYFFSIFIQVDRKNNTRRLIHIGEPSFDINKHFLTNVSEKKARSSYLKLMEQVALLLDCNNKTRAHKELGELLEFNRKLAGICLKKEEARNPESTYNPMTINELQKKFSYIPWLKFINNLFLPYKVVNSHDTIILSSPKYFEKLNGILVKTKKRVIANYMYWKTVVDSESTLNKTIENAFDLFYNELSGMNITSSPKWLECLYYASDRLPLAVGSLYIKNYFNATAKEKVEKIVRDFNSTFAQVLKNIDWMDDVTKKAAMKKLSHMSHRIAFANELLDEDKINEYYKDLTVDPKSLLKTEENFYMNQLKHAVKLLKEPVKKYDWTTSNMGEPQTVNAYYSITGNALEIPSGILQNPFFNADSPRYSNYAGVGLIVGHEITHGFDDVGRKYDYDGRLNSWWQSETEKKFLKKAECIVKQYNNYTSEDGSLKLNGNFTLGENIADNGGIKLAYKAYENWQKDNAEEPRLPGLESYTPKQLFWISFAHGWCAKYRPKIQKLLIMGDSHSINRYRVIGPLSNRPEFSRDFNCPKGSLMNPDIKCDVW